MVTLTRNNGSVSQAAQAAHREVASLKGVEPHRFFGIVHGATDCHCVICGKALSDALSCTKMIGPVCSKKYYTDEPVVSDGVMEKVVGLVAGLDGRHNTSAGSIDPDVIDFLMANRKSSRAFANILLAWGSVNAAKAARSKVLAISPIFRELGYGNLADRLEKDRTPHRIDTSKLGFGVVVPAKDLRGFEKRLRWVKVKFTRDLTKSGKTRKLIFESKDKATVWLVIKSCFWGKPLSIEGKGVITVAKLTDKERSKLEALDTYKPPTPAVVTPTLFCRVEPSPTNPQVLRVFCTPPWEDPKAASFIDSIRSVKGRRWDGVTKCWTVPASYRKGVIETARLTLGVTVR